MRPEIKFCGLTRREDAEVAATVGAAYVGAIFAGGPRNLSAEQAADVLAGAGLAVKRVGVFGHSDADAIARVADASNLDIIQMHGDPGPDAVDSVRRRTGREIWAVMRIAGTIVPDQIVALAQVADAVLIDARVDGALGGTGVPVAWHALGTALRRSTHGRRLVLAGGLTPASVGEAIAAVAPDIVDVSSGVESSPGKKDHEKMRAFALAVRG